MGSSVTETHRNRERERTGRRGRVGEKERGKSSSIFIKTHFKLLVKLGEQVECSLHMCHHGNWSKSKEGLDLCSKDFVEGEPSEPHHCALRVSDIEELLLFADSQSVVHHGWKILLQVGIKTEGRGMEVVMEGEEEGSGGEGERGEGERERGRKGERGRRGEM